MKNSLGNEASLYLKQHANNPVAWQIWGQAAFEQAQKEDKPVLISIGYSSCHWCHVMAEECFADSYIADIMNEHFVCIKVDREERPDVDQVYMEAVQMILQRGGWPLNVFCLPDGRPFFGGTYFPPEDLGNGLIPWPQLLIRIAEHYRKSKDELVENAEAIRNNLIAQSACSVDESSLAPSDLIVAAEGICGNHDDQYGGFGAAPKFPQAMVYNFLLAMREFEQSPPALRNRIDTVLQVSLRAMAHGGIYDQIGGGFSRYSVDAHWLIPHFEKMLYDNALLVDSYLRAWLRYKVPLYRSIVEETVAWLDRDMRLDSGLYAASMDADVNGVEGQYYTWDLPSIQSVLGEDLSKVFSITYGLSAKGNFESNTSVLALQDGDFSLREDLQSAREALRDHRDSTRIKPRRDAKALTAWNCLLASSLAEAGFYMGRSEWLVRARSIVDTIGERLIDRTGQSVILNSVHYANSGKRIEGYLHDYTYYANALLSVASKIDWLEWGASQSYLDRAEACMDAILLQFKDPNAPGFYFTAEGAEAPVVRRKEWFDNALPSGNAMLLQVLSALYQLKGKGDYKKLLEREASAYGAGARQHASAIACGLEALASRNSIAVIRSSDASLFESLRLQIIEKPWRRLFLLSDPHSECQLCIGATCCVYDGDFVELLSNY